MRTLALAVLLMSVSAACGGGGSAPAPGPGAPFVGTYAVAGLNIQSGMAPVAGASWGTGSADGIESISFDAITTNLQGSVMGPQLADTGRYFVGLDRTLSVRADPFPLLDFLVGGITADGSVAVVGSGLVASGLVQIYTRVEGTWSTGSLSGEYHIVGYAYDHVLDDHDSWVGIVTFDGLGGASVSAGINRNGTVVPFGPSPLTYGVAADGTVTIDLVPGLTLSGRLSNSADLLVAAGSTQANGPQACFAMIRVGAGMTDSAFDGTYHTVGIARDMAAAVQRTVSGGVFPDAGSIAWILRRVDTGGQIGLDSDMGTYTVLPNGSLVVTTLTDELRGAVSPDGTFALLMRSSPVQPDPTFWFLLR